MAQNSSDALYSKGIWLGREGGYQQEPSSSRPTERERELKDELDEARREIATLKQQLKDQEVRHQAELEKTRRQFSEIINGSRRSPQGGGSVSAAKTPRGPSLLGSPALRPSPHATPFKLKHAATLPANFTLDMALVAAKAFGPGSPTRSLLPNPGSALSTPRTLLSTHERTPLASSTPRTTGSGPSGGLRPLRPQPEEHEEEDALESPPRPRDGAELSPSTSAPFDGRALSDQLRQMSLRSSRSQGRLDLDDMFVEEEEEDTGRDRVGLIYSDISTKARVRLSSMGQSSEPAKQLQPDKYRGVELVGACCIDHAPFVQASPFNANFVAVANSPENSASVWDWRGYPGLLVSPPLPAHTKRVTCVAFSLAHEHILATGSEDEAVNIVDYQTGFLLTSLEGLSGAVHGLAFVKSDPSFLVAAYREGNVKLWNYRTGREMKNIRAFDSELRTMSICPFRENVMLVGGGGADRELKLMNFVTGETSTRLEYPQVFRTGVFCSEFHPKEELAAVAGDLTICIFDTESGKAIAELGGHTSFIVTLAWSPHLTHILASGALDKCIRVWDTRTASCLFTVALFSMVRSMHWSPVAPRTLLVGGEASGVGLANLKRRLSNSENGGGFNDNDKEPRRAGVRAFNLASVA